MMEITLRELGGFGAAPLMNAPPREVRVDALGEDAVAQARSLVASAERKVSERSTARSGDARMGYVIRVSDQGRERELRFHDDDLCAEAEDLIAWVKQHS